MVNFRNQSSELHARSFLESLGTHNKSNCRRCKIRLTANLLFTEMTATTRSILVIWTKSTQRVQVIAGRTFILKAALILLDIWEKCDNYQLARSRCNSMIMTPLFSHEELSSQLRTSPYSTFLMKQHIINSSLLDFSAFPSGTRHFRQYGSRSLASRTSSIPSRSSRAPPQATITWQRFSRSRPVRRDPTRAGSLQKSTRSRRHLKLWSVGFLWLVSADLSVLQRQI